MVQLTCDISFQNEDFVSSPIGLGVGSISDEANEVRSFFRV